MASDSISSILIVGGGSAGWMSAAYLNSFLDDVEITLVESEKIGILGVGEGSIDSLKDFFDFIGVKEEEWMPKCHATYKMGIKFVNWTKNPSSFYHPFEPLRKLEGLYLSEYWLRQQKDKPFASCYISPSLCESNRAPVENGVGKVAYGYHFNARLLAEYLRELCLERGTVHIVDEVCKVNFNENGEIENLETIGNRKLSADLFIDASGFSGILINKAMKEPFISYSDSLLCDRVVAINTPNPPKEDIRPYTIATALRAGWAWQIPLFNRKGNGYVYSSKFISQEEAEKELREFIGASAKDQPAVHIAMRCGRTRNAWVKNCVSIGLSSGFLEPLEAFGVSLIHSALYYFQRYFPSKKFGENLIKKYNDKMKEEFEKIRDFLILHYCITGREDTDFWKANKYQIKVPEKLKRNIALWKEGLPRKYFDLIGSYHAIMIGMNYITSAKGKPSKKADKVFRLIQKYADVLKERLPSHSQVLEKMYGEARLNS